MEKPNGNKKERWAEKDHRAGRVRLQENHEGNLRLERLWKQEEWPHCSRHRTVKLNFWSYYCPNCCPWNESQLKRSGLKNCSRSVAESKTGLSCFRITIHDIKVEWLVYLHPPKSNLMLWVCPKSGLTATLREEKKRFCLFQDENDLSRISYLMKRNPACQSHII